MRFLILSLAIFCFSFSAFTAEAQNDKLSKADKYYELFAFKQAIPFYLDILKADDVDTRAVARLADCYRKTGNLKESSYWYSRIVERKDRNPEDLFDYAQVLKGLGLYTQAKSWFNAYARYNNDKGSYYAKSCDYALANKVEGPVKIYNEKVNTTSSEFAPAYFKDKVVFSSFRKDKIPSGSSDALNKDSYNGLFISPVYGSGRLRDPLLLKTEYKLETNQCYVSYNDKGDMVAFVKNNNNFTDGVLPLPGRGVKMDIYISSVKGESTWEDEVAFTFNGARYSTSFPYLSPDGNTLYFASDIPGGFGGFDLYMSTRIGSNWSEPKNLGSRVNTPGNEVSPFLSGGKLFFASDWHEGFGGLDIFSSDKVDGVWGKVTNLGYGVNSSRDDLDFIYNFTSNTGFFTSDRTGGQGKHDIYQAVFPKPIGQTEAVTSTSEADPSQVFYLGRIINSETEMPVQGVSVKALSQKTGATLEANSDGAGKYELALKEGMSYRLVFSKVGYLNQYRTVEVTPEASKTFLKTTEIEPSPLGFTTDEGFALTNSSKAPAEPVSLSSGSLPDDSDFTGSAVAQGKAMKDVVPETNSEKANLTTVYEVQVGVYSNPNSSKLASLGEIGNVYAEPRGDLKVYKVGPYATKEEAEKAKTKAIDQGFPGSFVKESTQNSMVASFRGVDKSEKSPVTTKAPETTTASPQAVSDIAMKDLEIKEVVDEKSIPGVIFKVQLGAYKDASKVSFDGRLFNWGELQTESLSNGLTRLMLGDFSSKKAADSAKIKAIEYGVSGAYVVAYRNGQKIPIEDAIR